MPPSKTRQRRKRKLQTETDNAQKDDNLDDQNDGRNGADDGAAGRTQKRSRLNLGRTAGGDDSDSDTAGSQKGNGSFHSHREFHVGSSNGTSGSTANRHSASLNGLPAARASSSAGGASLLLRLSQRSELDGEEFKRVQIAGSGRDTIVAAETAGPTPAAAGGNEKASSVSQKLRRLAQDDMRNNRDHRSTGCGEQTEEHATSQESVTENDDGPAREQPTLCNNVASSQSEDSNCSHADGFDEAKREWKGLVLFSIAYSIIMIVFSLSAIVYAQHCNHDVAILEMDARHALAASQHAGAMEGEIRSHERTRLALEDVRGRLEFSEERAARLQHELADAVRTHGERIVYYESVFEDRDRELDDAVERIKILRGDREDSDSAMDLAWLRMDELMEENDELSHELREARRALGGDGGGSVARVRLRDRELIGTVESLTRQLKRVSDEKDELDKLYKSLLGRSEVLSSEYEILHHDHDELTGAYLAPLLVYVGNLQRSSETQHSVILELTSLVHSLHSSLEMSRSNLETQAVESRLAVDAIAAVAGERTQTYEMERSQYMQHMELQLETLEAEAMGAVNAVADAAGRLEYERKVEEEERWRGYVAEAETILGGIREIHWDGSGPRGEGGSSGGVGEGSVLRAAISRRIEEGIASLRSYVHPYNYLAGRDDESVRLIQGPSKDGAVPLAQRSKGHDA